MEQFGLFNASFVGVSVYASVFMLYYFLLPSALAYPPAMSNTAAKSAKSHSHSTYAHLAQAHAALKAHHYSRAFNILKIKAKQGCPYSQTMLGHMYATGIGANQSFERAAHRFEKAAEQGYANAQLALGKLYLGGERVVRAEEHAAGAELAKAVFWLRKAAAQGIDEAHELLAKIPGEKTAEYRVAQTRAEAVQAANQAESGVVTGWKGYADMTNTLNQASQQGSR